MTIESAVRPAVGVGGVVLDAEGRILLVRRKYPPQAGFWHIPGGRLEAGETLAECCRREVLEETGIRVNPGPILAIADRAIEGFHYIIIDFLAELTPDSPREPHPSSDATEASWVPAGALATYPLVEGLTAVIQAAQAPRLTVGLSAETDCPWLYVPVSAHREKRK